MSREFSIIVIDLNLILNTSLSAPAIHQNPMPTSFNSSPPLQSGHSSGTDMELESAASANFTILHNSKRPQRSAAKKAAVRIEQIEHLPTQDTPKKKSPQAAFQLTNKDIPDGAGHIKVGPLR